LHKDTPLGYNNLMISKRLSFVLLFLMALPFKQLFAHPVTYQDGRVLTSSFDGHRLDILGSYSYTHRDAIGLSYSRLRDRAGEQNYFLVPRISHLLKRWNMPAAQANIYLWGGAGMNYSESDTRLAGTAGFQSDYETRRIYTQADADTLLAEGSRDFNRARYRFGVAPYLAEFDELQTFLIAEARYASYRNDKITFGPVVRLFYQTYLMELGVDNNGDLMAMGMIHF